MRFRALLLILLLVSGAKALLRYEDAQKAQAAEAATARLLKPITIYTVPPPPPTLPLPKLYSPPDITLPDITPHTTSDKTPDTTVTISAKSPLPKVGDYRFRMAFDTPAPYADATKEWTIRRR